MPLVWPATLPLSWISQSRSTVLHMRALLTNDEKTTRLRAASSAIYATAKRRCIGVAHLDRLETYHSKKKTFSFTPRTWAAQLDLRPKSRLCGDAARGTLASHEDRGADCIDTQNFPPAPFTFSWDAF